MSDYPPDKVLMLDEAGNTVAVDMPGAQIVDRLAELERAVRWYIKHVRENEGTDFLSSAYVCRDDEQYATVLERLLEDVR